MPSILDGYCSKSPLPRGEAEEEAREFLQIIEDSASYQFGMNHSIAYCMLGYLCAYFRHYHPLEFITSFLNNAANEDDIRNGTAYANKVGIKVTMPKFGLSRRDYFFNKSKGIIAKGLSSVKFIGNNVADELYNVSAGRTFDNFVDVLLMLGDTSLNTRQVDVLIKIDFFSDYGNQRELLRIADLYYNLFKSGTAKKIAKDKVEGSPLGSIISRFSIGNTKAGAQAKSFTILDMHSILVEVEKAMLSLGMSDLDDRTKMQNFEDIMGYAGYVSNIDADRPKLYITDVFQLVRKRDGKQFGYSVLTRSVGSGKESRFTVFNRVFNENPIKRGDMIYCRGFERDGQYFTLTKYDRI